MSVYINNVASFTGAWVETMELTEPVDGLVSHPLRVRGLKLSKYDADSVTTMSHPLRVRGLKPVS